MGRLALIGGGQPAGGETLSIDRHVVAMTGHDRPTVLFIPTASMDREDGIEAFHTLYGEQLGCEVRTLEIIRHGPSVEDMRRALSWAQIIYIGGGKTRRMLALWRAYGLDTELLRIYRETDKVLVGISAGAIWWFKQAHCDVSEVERNYDTVKGIGLFNGYVCPHFNNPERNKDFMAALRQTDEIGVGIEDHAALVIDGDRITLHQSREHAMAYLLPVEGDQRSMVPFSEAIFKKELGI